MAYRARRTSYRGRSSYRRAAPRRGRRRATARRGSAQRIVIQVIGGPGGMVPISATAGKKGKRVLRARH